MSRVHVGLAVVALSVASAVSVGRAEAQATAEPFHAGQWGIETDVTANNGALLRFLTSRTALILGATGTHSSFTEGNGGGGGDIKTEDNLFTVSLGVRHHSPIAPGISATTGASAFIGSAQERREFSATPAQNNTFRSDNYGVFGDVGAQYMPTSHVAVGVAYRLLFRHDKIKTFEEKGTRFSTMFVPIRATLYF